MKGQGKKGHAAEPVTRKCLLALKNRNYIGRTSSEKVGNCESSIRQVNRIYYWVGYTLGALNSQDPVTGGGKYNAKERKGKGTHPRATLRPDPRSRPRIHKLEYSLRIRNHPRTQSEDFPLLLHPIPASRQDTQASPLELFGSYRESRSRPTDGYTGEESSAEHGSSGDPLR
ncbi:hypothetical protein GN958_ATG03219 [Phytophthora infestans]|uniref:Uncharacterized protein n=1 Tax=Phytophthora infestans TaxID=4787 RepID=A0A8S9V8R5_PHYIN|nr:hypothetical protein GN958_ATG03219 [Phytophthora infestans]